MSSYRFLIILLLLSMFYQSLAMEQNSLIALTQHANYLLALDDEALLKFITQEGAIATNLKDIIMPQSTGYHLTESPEVVEVNSAELTSRTTRKKRSSYKFNPIKKASLETLQLVAPHFGLNQCGQESKHQMPLKDLTICPFDNCKKKLSELFELMQHITLVHIPLKVQFPEIGCRTNEHHTLAALKSHLTTKHKDVKHTNAVAIATFKEKLQQSLHLHFLPLQIDSIAEPRQQAEATPIQDVLSAKMNQQFTDAQIGHFKQIAPYFGLDIEGQEIGEITVGYKCVFCPQTSRQATAITQHMTGHLPIDMICPRCNIIFAKRTLPQLSRHLRSQHPECKTPYPDVRQIYKDNLQKILQNASSIISAPASSKRQNDLSSNEITQIKRRSVEAKGIGLPDAQTLSMVQATELKSAQDDLIAYLSESANRSLDISQSLQQEAFGINHSTEDSPHLRSASLNHAGYAMTLDYQALKNFISHNNLGTPLPISTQSIHNAGSLSNEHPNALSIADEMMQFAPDLREQAQLSTHIFDQNLNLGGEKTREQFLAGLEKFPNDH